MTTEANLWEWLRDVALPLGQYSRIESGDTAPGFPDVHCQLGPRISPTLELKCAKNSGAPIPFTKKTGMRRSQLKWIRENIKKGGTVWVIAEVSPYVHIIPGELAGQINGASAQKLFGLSEVTANRRKNEEAALIFYSILIGRVKDDD